MTRLLENPFLLGDRTLGKVSNAGYPPYDIERIGEQDTRITLAVAGFSRHDLSVEIENGQLVIRGRQEERPQREFLHRGIASRRFQRSFVLAEGIQVVDAKLDNGLLRIDLRRPERKTASRSIRIQAARAKNPETS